MIEQEADDLFHFPQSGTTSSDVHRSNAMQDRRFEIQAWDDRINLGSLRKQEVRNVELAVRAGEVQRLTEYVLASSIAPTR